MLSFVDALDASSFDFFEDIFVVISILCCDVVDGVLVLLEQIAYAVVLVQGVELFLGHLFELFDELENVIVLVLACIASIECDLFELFDGVFLVFVSCTPYRDTHSIGHVGILVPVTLVLES